MLDSAILSQLQELKKEIRNSVPRDTGTVKGTNKRFGFVVADTDGQQYLLPQAEMEKVLPGDRIQFILEKGIKEDEKPVARIEKFLGTEMTGFIGVVKVQKEQMFVIPDLPHFNRWVFVPPKSRKGVKDGDLVAAAISQHPFKANGRVQAEIKALIGQPNDPFIEHRYAIVKSGIEEKIWQREELDAIRHSAEQKLDETIPTRQDLRETPFFTIDGLSTQDLDDALHIVASNNGWKLQVAISDVAAFVEAASPLDRLAARQASSIYMPGQKVPMLPDVLASDICSLRPQQDRLAIVCELSIGLDGQISDTRYEEVVIQSKAKLNYDEVAEFLDQDGSTYPEEIRQQLSLLRELTKARLAWRKQHALLLEEYADCRIQLDERGKISSIERVQRNSAQRLVEECMLACNEATARYLNEKLGCALYLSHNGFKPDQLPGVEKLASQCFPEFEREKIGNLDGYLDFSRKTESNGTELPIREILRKKMVRSEWVATALPHFGLGLPCYTTFTSPIRKYSDLLVHRMVKALIHEDDVKTPDAKVIEQLNAMLQAVRDAQRDCELSLKCQYIDGFRGKQYEGEVSMINHRSMGVYLPEFDVHGQIDLRSLENPFVFQQESLQLLSEKMNFRLKQKVAIEIDHVDLSQRQVKLRLVA